MKRTSIKQPKKRTTPQISSTSKLPPVNTKNPQPNPTLNAISSQQQGLVSVLHQYFMKNNFLQTLQSFQRDCTKPVKGVRTHQQIKKQLLSMFDQGLREQFINKFWQFVPISMRAKDPQTMKMQFYIRLYFFVYPTHPFLGKKKVADVQVKQSFIGYLEGRGAALSKLPQFLQYYALTNVHKPHQHPQFKAIFTRQWVVQLRKRVAYFLDKLYPPGRVPSLVVMYDRFVENLERQSHNNFTEQDEEIQIQQAIQQQESALMNPQPVLHEKVNIFQKSKVNTYQGRQQSSELQALKAKIQQLQQQKDSIFQHLQDQKRRSLHWQNTYQQFSQAAQNILMQSQSKWFQITQQIYSISDQILTICRKLQEGVQLADPNIIQEIAMKLGKYQKFMKMDLQQMISADIDFSVFQRPDKGDVSVDMSQLAKPQTKLIQLDFAKITQCLTKPQNNDDPYINNQISQSKILLLQALRWRIIKPKSNLAKRAAVLSFTIYDVLGLTKETDSTLQILLKSKNDNLIMQTIGFVNSLTRDYYGRQYLVCHRFYSLFTALFTNQKLNQQARMHLLLSFQWCSTKKLAQQLMIKNDMIRVIVSKLDRERQTIPSYYLQYMVALLVNILLHKDGPKKAQQIDQDIMRALINLIQSDSMSVRSYVHGSLYPLLSNKIFRQKAKAFGLLDNINFLLENKQSQEHHNQLLYLKKKLQEDQDDPDKEQQQEQQDNDQDELLLGEYIQQGDEYVQLKINGIKGEQLLMKEYLLLGPESLTQMNKIQDLVAQTLQRKSILADNSFYQRESLGTPLLSNKLRRNISNNNSVYSNKSSNRILRSEKNSRTNITPPIPTNRQKVEKLDTVPQNNSQVSIKQYQQRILVENNKEFEETFRGRGEERGDENGSNAGNMFEGMRKSGNGQKKGEGMKKEGKTYEATDQYQKAFQTRALLVRTPPRK